MKNKQKTTPAAQERVNEAEKKRTEREKPRPTPEKEAQSLFLSPEEAEAQQRAKNDAAERARASP